MKAFSSILPILKPILSAGSVVAAPFTAGTSLAALPAILGGASALTGLAPSSSVTPPTPTPTNPIGSASFSPGNGGLSLSGQTPIGGGLAPNAAAGFGDNSTPTGQNAVQLALQQITGGGDIYGGGFGS